jgi:ketosteroid isomerase-like protein
MPIDTTPTRNTAANAVAIPLLISSSSQRQPRLPEQLFRVNLTNVNIASASPPVPSPTRTCLSFARAVSAGDLDRAAACFARDGCLLTPDATAVHGREHIRGVLAQMVSRRTEIQVELSSAVSAGEVILVHQRWRIRSGEQPEERFEQTFDAVLILQRIEGAWKLSIAAPWGYRQAYG